jgi:uncharacterized membrane protein YcgQ (UPF0703/DUF1980 family)
MKTLKIVAILSTLILIVMIVEFASLPLQYPDSSIAWFGILLWGYFLFCLCILSPLGLILPLTYIRKIMIGMVVISFALMGLGFVPFPFEIVFIAGILIFNYSIAKILENQKTTENARSK